MSLPSGDGSCCTVTVAEKAARLRAAFFYFLVFVNIVLTGQAWAMWARYSDTELIAASPLIVMAEFIGGTSIATGSAGHMSQVGVLRVTEVLKGDKTTTVVLINLPASDQPRGSDAIQYARGQSGLWFLYATPGTSSGLLRADHPQRFIPAATTAKIDAFRRLLSTK